MGIGVGTPSRVIDLLDAGRCSIASFARFVSQELDLLLNYPGALSSSKLERVIVDASHIDQKKRGIFDMRETQQPLMQLLNRPEIKDRYGSGKGDIQLIVY